MLCTSHGTRQDGMKFHGTFKKIRELRDYSYHVNYTKERQSWQDQARPPVEQVEVKQCFAM